MHAYLTLLIKIPATIHLNLKFKTIAKYNEKKLQILKNINKLTKILT